MQKLVTSLWFNNCAEEAVNFYVSVFNNSAIKRIGRYSEAGPEEPGKVMSIDFQLEGQDFLAINSQHEFPFTPAISLVVNCEGQAELDKVWDQLAIDPDGGQCGWLEDKYGLSWQIVTPKVLELVSGSSDPVKATAVHQAMFAMKKLDEAELQKVYDEA